MKLILIICILLLNLQNCEQSKSTGDKMKSNYKDKPDAFLKDYFIVRTFFGRYAFGDPLCGGDPIGTALGLNNDIPKPITAEVGKSYEYAGNVNLANVNGSRYNQSNLFLTSHNGSKNIEVKLTLTADCIGQGIDGFYFNVGICNANGFQYISNISNCIAGFSVLNVEKKKRILKDDYELCTVSNSINSFFILVIENNCKYKLELKGV